MIKKERKQRTYLSPEDREHVVRLIKKMLGMGKYSSDIKRAVAEEFQLSPRSVGRYLKRARQEMISRMKVTPDTHRAESFYFYRSLINNPDVHPREKLRARERIDKLFGLDLEPPCYTDGEITPAKLQAMSDDEFNAFYNSRMN